MIYCSIGAGHGVRGNEGLVQSLVESGDGILQVISLLLDIQWIIGGYNAPPFCGITRVLDNYYGMAATHRLLNHNILMTLYDS